MQLLFHFMARLRAIVRQTVIGPQASAARPRHFPGQKLRLGGDALGADPTYLLYLPYRSRGELRRIDFEPDCAGATLSDFAAPRSSGSTGNCRTSRSGAHTLAAVFRCRFAHWCRCRLAFVISFFFCARRYFDHKRREQLERERGGGGLGGEEGEDLTTEPAAARYAGGGYNLGAQ